jgi:hypothetical protein
MAEHYQEIVDPQFIAANTKKIRGDFVPIALLTRDASRKLEEKLNNTGIDTKTWMMPMRPDLPETQFVLYKVEVPFEMEERAACILSDILMVG